MKRKARRIVVDDQVFAWYAEEHIGVLRLYAENRHGFLEIIFLNGSGGWSYVPQGSTEHLYNIHRPAVIAALIRQALQSGWQPDQGKQLSWRNGEELLVAAKAPFDSASDLRVH